MIDEKKLIEEMAEEIENIYGRETELSEKARRYLEQPKIGEWIPCDKKLPEIDSFVIITDKDGYVLDNICYGYAEETDSKPCFHRWDDEYWQCFKPKVIAWQPLPEPYKGEEE